MLIHLLYYLFAGIVAMAALTMLLTSQVFYAALCLVGVSVGLSAIYFLQGASFIAVIYLIVYAGGVLVLILFTLLSFKPSAHQRPRYLDMAYQVFMILVGCLLLAPLLIWSMRLVAYRTSFVQADELNATVAHMGYQLLGPYGLLLEMVGILLLIALIGALYIIQAWQPFRK